MLPRDKGGVVDPTLKVYGTTNLRVVDLSIVPLHFAAHSQGKRCAHIALIAHGFDYVAMLATVYVIAEQGEFTFSASKTAC